MTDPSQYFKGRTVQEQMDEVIGYVDVRSAEVATTAIASDVAQVHQDMLDADVDAAAAAASAAAAAGTLANAVKKTGEASQSIAGNIAVTGDVSAGGLISGTRVEAPTPVFNNDAANKKYVDDADAALKTYVDTQDATKISITDINNYAVGLTGNQVKAGILKFAHSPPDSQMGLYEHGYGCTLTDVPSFTDTPAQTEIYDLVSVYADDGTFLNALRYVRSNDGKHSLEFVVHLQDDTTQFIRLAITS